MICIAQREMNVLEMTVRMNRYSLTQVELLSSALECYLTLKCMIHT